MNIVKFKDIIHPTDTDFNEYLKGQYTWFVHMRYAVPFSELTSAEYTQCELNINNLLGSEKKFWDLITDFDYLAYVDESATAEANSISTFSRINDFSTDPEITIDDVKRFRTWLAETLLTFDQEHGEQKYVLYSERTTHMLQYYAGGMYDDVVKWLSQYTPNVSTYSTTVSECGCNYGLSDLNLAVSTCDPLYIYRNNVYDDMVKDFGSLVFWFDKPVDFLSEFKLYIDNIIKLDLPLTTVSYALNLTDCGCIGNTAQTVGMEILTRLSKALGYLIAGESSGNKNFIGDAFLDFAKNLYEKMYWV